MVARSLAAWALVTAGVVAGCSRASDEGETKHWQSQPPPKDVDVPAGLVITVTVNGMQRAPITTDTLKTVKPDFADVERRAWLITTLIAEAAPTGAGIEAAAPTGVSVTFGHPMPDGLEPALYLTRRGELIVGAIDPKDPFPRFHGQGGRLHRAGDSTPRVAPVARLAVTLPPTK